MLSSVSNTTEIFREIKHLHFHQDKEYFAQKT